MDIAQGTGTQTIARQLEQAGVIRSRYAFELLRLKNRGKLQAGEYRFNHPALPSEVYARIAKGDVFTLSLTIPEGYNIFDIAQAVEAAGLGSRDTFLDAEQQRDGSDLGPEPGGGVARRLPVSGHVPVSAALNATADSDDW